MHEGAITLMITTNENTTMNEKNNEFRSKKIKKAVTTLSQCQLNFTIDTPYVDMIYYLLCLKGSKKKSNLFSIHAFSVFKI